MLLCEFERTISSSKEYSARTEATFQHLAWLTLSASLSFISFHAIVSVARISYQERSSTEWKGPFLRPFIRSDSASRQRASGPSPPETPFNFENFIEEIPSHISVLFQRKDQLEMVTSPTRYLPPLPISYKKHEFPKRVYKSSRVSATGNFYRVRIYPYKFYP